MIDLDCRTFRVGATAANGVVGAGTRLRFVQRGRRVAARYSGGRVAHGWLVGEWIDDAHLRFRYVQCEEPAAIHAGSSVCEVQQIEPGRLRVHEHFAWSTRAGTGTNVFDEA